MKTWLLPVFFLAGLLTAQAQNGCCETAFQFFDDDPDSPLPDSLASCLEAELRAPFDLTILSERHRKAQGLIALSNHYAFSNYIAAERVLIPVKEILREDGPDEDKKYLATAYNLFAIYYEWLLQYDLAELYATRCREIWLSLNNYDLEVYTQDANLASLYSKIGKFDEGVAAADRAIIGAEPLTKDTSDPKRYDAALNTYLGARHNKAVVLSEKAKREGYDFLWLESEASCAASLRESKKLLPIVERVNPERKPGVLLQIIATYTLPSAGVGAADSLIVYIDELERLFQGQQVHDHLVGSMQATRGGALAKKGQLAAGLAENTRGLQLIGYPVVGPFDAPQPVIIDLQQALALMAALTTRARILHLWYEKDKKADIRYLRAAVALMERNTDLTHQMLRDQQTDESMVSARTLLIPTFNTAAIYAAELYRETGVESDFARSFDFAERSKALALRNKMTLLQAKMQGLQGKSAECRKQEMNLLNSIFESRAKGDQNAVFYFSKCLKDTIEAWKQSPDPEVRRYYLARFDDNTASLQMVRNELLDDETALISYLWAYPKPIVYVITKTHTETHFLTVNDTLLRALNAFIVLALADDKGDPQNVARSQYLYEVLLKSALEHPAMNAVNRLVLIEDSMLREVPFEALRMKASTSTNPSGHGYLVEKYVVGYEYSATVWRLSRLLAMEKPAKDPGMADRIAVFAARYANDAPAMPNCDNRNLDSLYEQARQIKTLFKNIDFRDSALVKDFTGYDLGNVDVLHFVMHTCQSDPADPQDYSLMFSSSERKSALRAADFYTFQVGAKLAVFGSCDIRQGMNKEGEGTFGLARALNYAGCQNMIATLHKVPDGPTAEIYASFYTYLETGMYSDVALTLAKRDYLKKHRDSDKIRPFYWANIICIGPPQVVRK